MALTIPNTFISGDVIAADKIDENNEDIRLYLNNSIQTADIQADSFRPEHIMRGNYQPLTNQYSFVSGLIGGKNYLLSNRQTTGICHTPSGYGVPKDPTYVWLANGSINFYLEEDADLLFQWYGQPYTTPIDDSRFTAARFYMAFDDELFYGNLQKTFNESFKPYRTRNFNSGFHMRKSVSKGWHSFGVKGYTTEAYSIFLAWGFTLEAFYKLPTSAEVPPDIPDVPNDPVVPTE